MIDDSKEYIIASAIWYKNGKHYPFQSVYGIDSGFVVGGFRHPMCISVCSENPYFHVRKVEEGNEALPFEWDESCCGKTEQGFITSHGRFVDRKEAFRIAKVCGQIGIDGERSLYSEDVFPEQAFYGKI